MKIKNLAVVTAAFFALIMPFSCASTSATSATAQTATKLPVTSGNDMFAGHTFISSNQRFEFANDRTFSTYVYNKDKSSWEKEFKASYSFDSKKGELYTKMISLYTGGVEFKSAQELVDAIYPAQEAAYNREFEKNKTDEQSKKNFLEWVKGSILNSANDQFNSMPVFTYSFSEDGKKLNMKMTLDTTLSYAAQGQIFALDPTNTYQLSFSRGIVSIVKIDPKTGNAESDGIFMGNCTFNDKSKTVTADMYQMTQAQDASSQRLVVPQKFTKAGKFKATYTIETKIDEEAKKQGYEVYRGAYNFKIQNSPKGTENLTSITIPVAFPVGSSTLTRDN